MEAIVTVTAIFVAISTCLSIVVAIVIAIALAIAIARFKLTLHDHSAMPPLNVQRNEKY